MTPSNKQPAGLQEGIYFGLSNDDYHADPALSRSGIKDILISERDHWENSRSLYPDWRSEPTKAMTFGTRCEMYLLEPDVFKKTFCVAGGRYDASKKVLTSAEYSDIVISTRTLKEDPKMAALLADGIPQVSIFWRCPETRIMLKVRPDLLKIMGCVDLKRVRSIQTNPLGWFIHDHCYDIQEAMCIDGVLQAKERLRNIDPKFKISGSHDREWLRRFIENPMSEFRFIFQRSTRPFIYKTMFFEASIRRAARERMMMGVRRYKNAIEKYGTGAWPAGTAEPEEFKQVNLPMRAFSEE